MTNKPNSQYEIERVFNVKPEMMAGTSPYQLSGIKDQSTGHHLDDHAVEDDDKSPLSPSTASR